MTDFQATLKLPEFFNPLLNPPARLAIHQGCLVYRFRGNPSLKHVVESLGIPHTEVDGVRVGKQWVDLSHHLQPGDHVEVVPAGFGPNGLPKFPGDTPRFILDNHLGKLATYLRILGFDCIYDPTLEDAGLAALGRQAGRILLTRDRQLLMRKEVIWGCWVRSKDPLEQTRYVLARYQLFGFIKPFQRCLRCNHPLESVPKEAVLHRLEPLTKKYYDTFYYCADCDQVYWPGSHYARMSGMVKDVLDSAGK